MSMTLEAGSLRCDLDGSDIRHLTMRGRRVLARLYVAVRDELVWNTIPFGCSEPALEVDAESFQASIRCEVNQPPIRAEWNVTILGYADGRFRYAMEGQMTGRFQYGKLGLNLHHPLPETLGSRYVARRGRETVVGRITSLVAPQLFVEGKPTGMFMPYTRLELGSPSTGQVVFSFEGDEFEMQDHRNWTDYNLKSYGTPLEVPIPFTAESGDRILQSVDIDLRGVLDGADGRARAPRSTSRHVARVARQAIAELPRIGSEFPDELERLGERETTLLRAANLDYVRVNLDATTHDRFLQGCRRAQEAAALGMPIELGVFSTPGAGDSDQVRLVCDWLSAAQLALERVIVVEGRRGFAIGGTAASGATVRAYRDAITEASRAVPIVSGTDRFFAELNRQWPELIGVDGLSFPICPQVHAADDHSLMENLWAQFDTARTARPRSRGRPVHIGAVVLLGKFGPYPGGQPDVPALSLHGDARQQAGFCAAWSVGSLQQLVRAAVASATYFELVGAGDSFMRRRPPLS